MKNATNKLLLMLAMLAVGAFACRLQRRRRPTSPPRDLGDGAMLRVVHASPDAPAVDVYAEGVATPLLTDVSYTETSRTWTWPRAPTTSSCVPRAPRDLGSRLRDR